MKSLTSFARGARTYVAVAALAASAWITAGCDTSSEEPSATGLPEPSVTAPAVTPPETPTPLPTSEVPAPSPSAAAFVDANGTWCPTSPLEWGDVCVVVALPEVRHVGDDDPSHVEYVYPGPSGEGDPRAFTDADYDFPPTQGECWTAGVDGYPSTSGAEFIFCPAGAVLGWPWVDDPLASDAAAAFAGEDLQDYTAQDRLYMTQEETPFPYVRSGE